jgi:ribonuclease HII
LLAPNVFHEHTLRNQGHQHMAGIDEAGRGCWAGPVVAAAVVLPTTVLTQPDTLGTIDDSKVLSCQQREHGYAAITGVADAVGVGVVPAYIIDMLGIVAATRLAMTVALLSLPGRVDALLIDAVRLEGVRLPQLVLIKGDAQSLSIAAASVIAKVTRDRVMTSVDALYPAYGFAAHKGYGTARHRQALQQYGICPLHRMTFRPIVETQKLVDAQRLAEIIY